VLFFTRSSAFINHLLQGLLETSVDVATPDEVCRSHLTSG